MHFINSLGRKSFFLLLCEKVLIFLSSIQWFWMAYFSFTFCFYLNFTTFRSFATVNVNPTLVCGKHELFDVFKTKLNFLSLIKRFFFSQIQLAQPAFTEIWHFDILHRWKSQVYFSVCNWLYCYIYFCLVLIWSSTVQFMKVAIYFSSKINNQSTGNSGSVSVSQLFGTGSVSKVQLYIIS